MFLSELKTILSSNRRRGLLLGHSPAPLHQLRVSALPQHRPGSYESEIRQELVELSFAKAEIFCHS